MRRALRRSMATRGYSLQAVHWLRRLLLHQRHPEPEAGSLPRYARDLDRPAVRRHDGAGDSQAHPRALADGRAFLAAVKLLEDQRQVERVDAGAVIVHAELQP